MKTKSIHVLVTIISLDETYGDVLLVTSNKNRAMTLRNKIRVREPILGLDYENLAEFEEVEVITLPLNQLVQNVDMEREGFHQWFAKTGRSTKLKLLYNKHLKDEGQNALTYGFWALSYYQTHVSK
jgi:hypothetical protein